MNALIRQDTYPTHCSTCRSGDVIVDASAGDVVCRSCGTVLRDRLEVDDSALRLEASGGEMTRFRQAHVNEANDIDVEALDDERKRKRQDEAGWGAEGGATLEQLKAAEARRRSRVTEALAALDVLGDRLQLPEHVRTRARSLLHEASSDALKAAAAAGVSFSSTSSNSYARFAISPRAVRSWTQPLPLLRILPTWPPKRPTRTRTCVPTQRSASTARPVKTEESKRAPRPRGLATGSSSSEPFLRCAPDATRRNADGLNVHTRRSANCTLNHVFGCTGTSLMVPIRPMRCGARCCTFSVLWMATCVPLLRDWAWLCLSAWTSSSLSSPSPSLYWAAVAARDDVAACRAEAWNWIVRPSFTRTSYHFEGGSGTLVTSPARVVGLN